MNNIRNAFNMGEHPYIKIPVLSITVHCELVYNRYMAWHEHFSAFKWAIYRSISL